MSHLVIPLINYSNALEFITQQKIVETNRYLQKAATLTTSYNYNHLFEESLFEQLYLRLNNEKKRKETYAPKLTNVNLPSKQLQTGHHIMLTWLHSMSMQAGEYIETTSGQSMSVYLPPHTPVETINDLRNGKILCRAIVAIIYDRHQLRQQAESGIVNINPSYYQMWTKNMITLEDIEKIRALQTHTLDLLHYLVSLTVIYLDMPPFKAMDLFSGKSDAIFAFAVCLMNASIPTVNKAEKDYFEGKISLYYQIVNQIEELKQEKVASLTTIFHEEKKPKVAEKVPIPPFTPTAATTIKESEENEGEHENEDKDEEEDEKTSVKEAGERKEPSEDQSVKEEEKEVEIKAKSILEQLYEFFVHQNSTKESDPLDSQEFKEREEQWHKALSESVEFEGESGVDVSSKTVITNTDLATPTTDVSSAKTISQSKSIDNAGANMKSVSVDRIVSTDDSHNAAKALSNPLEDTDETASLAALMQTRLPKVQYSLDMPEESYQQLCKLLDEFIVSPESTRILEISEKSFVISEKLAELQSAITLIRDHRDEGIRLTTDIRQFVIAHSMKQTYINRNND